MCSAGLKVRNFQARTEPIRLFSISNFPSIVKDELAVLQQRAAVQKTAETRITYDTLLCFRALFFAVCPCVWQPYSLTSFGMWVGFFKRLGNVYG